MVCRERFRKLKLSPAEAYSGASIKWIVACLFSASSRTPSNVSLEDELVISNESQRKAITLHDNISACHTLSNALSITSTDYIVYSTRP